MHDRDLIKLADATYAGKFTAGNYSARLDGSSHNVLQDLSVWNVGDEAIHLRAFSSDNVVRDSVIRMTGVRNAAYGEGLYVGSANSNGATYSGGQRDTSDRNQLLNNTISATGAESIDMKGNAWTVDNNKGTNALLDGFQVHNALPNWGWDNTFLSAAAGFANVPCE